jgi:hypothetical protein
MQCAGATAQKLDGVPVSQTVKRERPKVDTVGFRPPRDGFDLAMEVAKEISKRLAVIVPEHIRRAEIARDLAEQRRATHNLEVNGASAVALAAAAGFRTING